jgi:methionyl-tRNA synthetase
MLKIEKPVWQYIHIPSGREPENVNILFQRIDKKVIEEEEARLHGCI